MSEDKHIPALRFKGFTDPWEQRKLGEVATFSKGFGYSKSDISDVGVPFIHYGRLYTSYETVIERVDTFTGMIQGSVFSCGSEVITPSSGETADDIAIASAVVSPGIILGGGLNVVHPTDLLDSIFLALSISYSDQHDELAKKAQGKSVVHLYNDDLKESSLSYPSIEEQVRISALFAKLDSLITLHQRKYDKLVVLKKSLLEKMFPKPDSKVPEIRFKGFTDPWEQRKLGEAAPLQRGFDLPTSQMKSGPYPVVMSNGIGGWHSKYMVKGPGIVTGRSGTIGKLQYVKENYWPHNTSLWVTSFYGNDPMFIYRLYESIRLERFESGSGVPTLNRNDVHNQIVLLPSDMDEQEAIGAVFTDFDSLITLHQRELDLLKNVKKSLLEKMFV